MHPASRRTCFTREGKFRTRRAYFFPDRIPFDKGAAPPSAGQNRWNRPTARGGATNSISSVPSHGGQFILARAGNQSEVPQTIRARRLHSTGLGT